MGPGEVIRRVVLDTNVVVSALLFERGRLSWRPPAWMAGDFRPLVSHATAAELLRVLSYPKFHLADDEIEALLGDFLPFAEPVSVKDVPAALPRVPDPDDRIFLQLAEAGTAEFLVTGDQDLLAVPPSGDYRIMSPTVFKAILRG